MYRIKQIVTTNLLGEVKSTYFIVQKHLFLIGWFNVKIPALYEYNVYSYREEDIELQCNTYKKAEEIIKYLKRKHEYKHHWFIIREVYSIRENKFIFLISKPSSKYRTFYSYSLDLDGAKKYIDEKATVTKTIIYE